MTQEIYCAIHMDMVISSLEKLLLAPNFPDLPAVSPILPFAQKCFQNVEQSLFRHQLCFVFPLSRGHQLCFDQSGFPMQHLPSLLLAATHRPLITNNGCSNRPLITNNGCSNWPLITNNGFSSLTVCWASQLQSEEGRVISCSPVDIVDQFPIS